MNTIYTIQISVFHNPTLTHQSATQMQLSEELLFNLFLAKPGNLDFCFKDPFILIQGVLFHNV